MIDAKSAKTVAICDAEPIAIEGVRAMLRTRPDLILVGSETTVAGGLAMVEALHPAITLLDKSFGMHATLDWVTRCQSASQSTAVVVWGTAINGAEAVRLMQAGAHGVIRKTAGLQSLLDCLIAVAAGRTWLEQSLLSDSERPLRHGILTPREQEVLDLVEQGMKNKDIAFQLGIRPGTVKIHLKHIFEKTGIHGRYGLALNGLKEKGLLTPALG